MIAKKQMMKISLLIQGKVALESRNKLADARFQSPSNRMDLLTADDPSLMRFG